MAMPGWGRWRHALLEENPTFPIWTGLRNGWHLASLAIQALLLQNAEFPLRHVQPTAVFGRVVDLQSLQQP
jgi:hypothetical protein